MRIGRLRGHNFRLFPSFELVAGAGINQIVGDNAQGKTSLLEALYLLGRGKSFRTAQLGDLSGPERNEWTLTSEIDAADGSQDRLGIGWRDRQRLIRLNGENAPGLVSAAALVPIQLIDPAAHSLLEHGPSFRRAYVDWGVFHVEHRFMAPWRDARRALQQRNRALRAGYADNVIRSWDPELARAAALVDDYRQAHVAKIDARLRQLVNELFGVDAVQLDLYSGWPRGRALEEVLASSIDSQRRLGHTTVGPHRAELRLRVSDAALKRGLSRGQQKLMVAAMVIAQSEVIARERGRTPVILIDDFAAELSMEFQRRFAAVVDRYAGQVFVTGFEPSPLFSSDEQVMFHVEHGHVHRSVR